MSTESPESKTCEDEEDIDDFVIITLLRTFINHRIYHSSDHLHEF